MGGTSIENIKIDLKSRDDIPPLLLGLQYIYTNVEFRGKVFEILEQKINPDASNNTGHPGNTDCLKIERQLNRMTRSQLIPLQGDGKRLSLFSKVDHDNFNGHFA